MTQAQRDRCYADWYSAYIEDVRDKLKHWGNRRSDAIARNDSLTSYDHPELDNALFASGR